jgi:hypothetical protein
MGAVTIDSLTAGLACSSAWQKQGYSLEWLTTYLSGTPDLNSPNALPYSSLQQQLQVRINWHFIPIFVLKFSLVIRCFWWTPCVSMLVLSSSLLTSYFMQQVCYRALGGVSHLCHREPTVTDSLIKRRRIAWLAMDCMLSFFQTRSLIHVRY